MRAAKLSLLVLGCLPLAGGCGSPPAVRTAGGRPDAPRIYRLYCFGCHGADGERGKPEMRLSGARGKSLPQIETIIRDGGKGMPAWKDRLKPDEIEAVAEHVRKLAGEVR